MSFVRLLDRARLTLLKAWILAVGVFTVLPLQTSTMSRTLASLVPLVGKLLVISDFPNRLEAAAWVQVAI